MAEQTYKARKLHGAFPETYVIKGEEVVFGVDGIAEISENVHEFLSRCAGQYVVSDAEGNFVTQAPRVPEASPDPSEAFAKLQADYRNLQTYANELEDRVNTLEEENLELRQTLVAAPTETAPTETASEVKDAPESEDKPAAPKTRRSATPPAPKTN